MNTAKVKFKYTDSLNLRDEIVVFSDVYELQYDSLVVIPVSLVIFACAEGNVKMRLNGRAIELMPMQLLICKRNDVLDKIELSAGSKCSIVGFSDRIIKDSLNEAHLWNKIVHLAENPVLTIGNELLQTHECYRKLLEIKLKEDVTIFNLEIIYALVKAVLYELLQQVEDCSDVDMNSLLTRKEVLFKNFIELLSTTGVKPRSVSWYADQLYITPKYLSAVCQAVCGKTSFVIINSYVMKDIRHLLKNSDKTIKEIADYLGFPNISFFGKYVKQHTGFSPMKLRASLRKG